MHLSQFSNYPLYSFFFFIIKNCKTEKKKNELKSSLPGLEDWAIIHNLVTPTRQQNNLQLSKLQSDN